MFDYQKINFIICKGLQEEFFQLQHLHETSMKDAVELSLGSWDKEVQYARLLKNFEKSYKSLKFIEYDKRVIGTINVRDEFFEDSQKTFSYVEQLYLYPEFQSFGLGSWLLQNYVPKHSRLSYLKNDKKAESFYEKNGYVVYRQDMFQKYAQR